MTAQEIIGYALAIIMGATIGIFGGGGSILTVPILVYVLGISAELATGYSLFIVGLASLVGAIRKHFMNHVAYQIGITFAIPSIVAVYVARRFVIPMIPDQIATIGSFELTKDIALMLLFAVVMLLAAYSMLRRKKKLVKTTKGINYTVVGLEGLGVGFVTGLVGAGGGFLIVPALVLFVGIPIQQAIGTSMLIIALKSLIGFTGDIGSGQEIDWSFLALFTSISLVGLFIGLYLGTKIDSTKLKRAFGWFILVMALLIVGLEIAK